MLIDPVIQNLILIIKFLFQMSLGHYLAKILCIISAEKVECDLTVHKCWVS